MMNIMRKLRSEIPNYHVNEYSEKENVNQVYRKPFFLNLLSELSASILVRLLRCLEAAIYHIRNKNVNVVLRRELLVIYFFEV